MPIEHILENKGETHVAKDIDIHLQLHDVQDGLGKLKDQPSILNNLLCELEKAKDIWQPALVYRWMDCHETEGGNELTCSATGESVMIQLNHSCGLLLFAERVLLGVYTVGYEIEQMAAELSSQGRIFDSYLYETISLSLLKKMQRYVCKIAEIDAMNRNWGVGAFLSPGSVHGWDLTEQVKICPLLPLKAIGVEINENGILNPFKSVSFLIGIGKQYTDDSVGSACRVCSMKDTCNVRRLRSNQE